VTAMIRVFPIVFTAQPPALGGLVPPFDAKRPHAPGFSAGFAAVPMPCSGRRRRAGGHDGCRGRGCSSPLPREPGRKLLLRRHAAGRLGSRGQTGCLPPVSRRIRQPP
jgi:hypothetical protein